MNGLEENQMTVMTKPETTDARAVVNAPALSPATIAKPDLITVEEAKAMDLAAHDRPVQGASQSRASCIS